MGQRSLGIGGDRNVSLDAESVASSGGWCAQGGLEPAFERADLDRIEGRVLPGAAVLRVPGIRSADALQREEEPKSYAWKIVRAIDDRKRWYELPEEVDGGP